MATPTTLGRMRTSLSFSLFVLIITALYFCGLSFAATPHVLGRQTSPKCLEDCAPKTQDEKSALCEGPGPGSERLRECANSHCGGDQVLIDIVCNMTEWQITSASSMIIPTSLVVASTTPNTTSSIGSTTSPSITPTTVVNGSSNDNSSGENTAVNKNGSDLSIPIIVGIAVGGTLFLGVCVGLWYLVLYLRKHKRRERKQKNVGGKGFSNSSMSDLGAPYGSGSKKEIGRGAPWIDEENNNNSTTNLHNTGVMNKPYLPPITTKFAPPIAPRPLGAQGGAPAGGVSPVSPVSPLSGHATFDERRSKAISTVSSMRPERTHRDFYNVSSPPLPTPASAVGYPSTRKSRSTNLVTGPGATNYPEPLEPVSPLSRNPSGKSNGTQSNVSAVGEEIGWEGYRDMIRKYEEQQAQGKPIPAEVIHRMSGLSQFNFGFGESQPQSETENKTESSTSFHGWALEKSTGGHLNLALGQNKDKYLSGSSSVYSSQPMTPPPPIMREAGPSTPEMFFGRPPPSYTPPSPSPATAGRSFVGVSQPSSHKPELPTGGLARANSLRWRREVEAAADQALKKIADPKDDKRKAQ